MSPAPRVELLSASLEPKTPDELHALETELLSIVDEGKAKAHVEHDPLRATLLILQGTIRAKTLSTPKKTFLGKFSPFGHSNPENATKIFRSVQLLRSALRIERPQQKGATGSERMLAQIELLKTVSPEHPSVRNLPPEVLQQLRYIALAYGGIDQMFLNQYLPTLLPERRLDASGRRYVEHTTDDPHVRRTADLMRVLQSTHQSTIELRDRIAPDTPMDNDLRTAINAIRESNVSAIDRLVADQH